VDRVCHCTALVSLEDEVEILARSAGFVTREIVTGDERDGMASVGREPLEPGNSVPEQSLCNGDLLQDDAKFVGLLTRHDRTSSPPSRMPATRAATYRDSTTRAVPKN